MLNILGRLVNCSICSEEKRYCLVEYSGKHFTFGESYGQIHGMRVHRGSLFIYYSSRSNQTLHRDNVCSTAPIELNIPGVPNLRLASHMWLFEGLFVTLKNSELKRLLFEIFRYSEQRTYVNHFIPL